MPIITNPEYLSETYLPKKLLYRDKEESKLANNIKNFISSLIHGPHGSGKTSLVKISIKDIASINVLAKYVDCTIYQTTYSILKEVVPRAKFIFSRSNYELLNELRRETKEKHFIICLDNFEKLKDKDLIKKFLLLGLTVVLITDEEENILLLTEDVRAKLSRIKLQPYSVEQTFDILKSRADKALAKWSYNDSVIRRIAEKCNGNITLGMNLLKLAAINAENRGRKTIEVTDIPVDNSPIKLNRDEKVILDILKERKILPANELYRLYYENSYLPKCERSFRNYMKSLSKKGLVKPIGEKRGRAYELINNPSE